jgi:hypothetical protein
MSRSRQGEFASAGGWRGRAERQQEADGIERGDPDIRRPDAEGGEQAGAGERADDAGRIRCGARQAHRAHELVLRDGLADQRVAHHQVGLADQAAQRGDDEDGGGLHRAGKGQRHQQRRHRAIEGPHHAQQGAVADAVADQAEDRREQRADVLQRGEKGQQQHRLSLDQDVPAEDQHLHLLRPGGREIGRPLEAEAADPEWRQHRAARRGRVGHLPGPTPFRPGRRRRPARRRARPDWAGTCRSAAPPSTPRR